MNQEETVSQRIGRNIRKCRRRKAWSQKTLAEKAGCSSTSLGLIEKGKKDPTIETVYRIFRALDLPVEALLEDVVIEGAVFSEYPGKLYCFALSLEENERIYFYYLMKQAMDFWKKEKHS